MTVGASDKHVSQLKKAGKQFLLLPLSDSFSQSVIQFEIAQASKSAPRNTSERRCPLHSAAARILKKGRPCIEVRPLKLTLIYK